MTGEPFDDYLTQDGSDGVTFVFEVLVTLKQGLSDPQGKAVEGSLPALGWTNVRDVHVGKHIRLDRGRGR